MVQSITEVWNALMGTSGFVEIVLPFILVFAIVYGLLSQLGLFDEKGKANALIAAVLAFFAVASGILAPFMAAFTGPWALWLVLILAVMIAGQLAGINMAGGRTAQVIGAIAILGVVLLIWLEGGFAAVFGTQPDGLTIPFIGPVDLVTVLILAAAAGLIYWLVAK